MSKINIEELRNREEYITCKKHDILPLLIWNYTNKCQFDGAWDECTIQARGLITDLHGNIVALPFKKFFNLGETEEIDINNLPNQTPEIFEKLDGSLGIQYYANLKVCIATRGSFHSEQAEWATNWISNKYTKDDFLEGYTYLYEIIYPENRIVVDYGDRSELVLIGVINTETGEEIDYEFEAKRLGLSCAKKINKSLEKLEKELSYLSINEEGYVIKYRNGLRLKMKGHEYVRLHSIISNISTRSIWDALKNNDSIDDLLKNVPDELFNWIEDKKNEYLNKSYEIYKIAENAYHMVKDFETRKEQAEYILNHKEFNKVSSIVFSLLDGKTYDDVRETIFNMFKPEHELPFKSSPEKYES